MPRLWPKTHPLAGFVARVVLLVDNDEREFLKARKDRHARPHQNARSSLMYGQPIARSLCGRKTRMHGHDEGLCKTRSHPGFQLRRQIDFRYQEHDLCFMIFGQDAFDDVQIDFSFAGASHSEKHKRRVAGTCRHRIGCRLLLVVENWRRFISDLLRLEFAKLLQTPFIGWRSGQSKKGGSADNAASPRGRR